MCRMLPQTVTEPDSGADFQRQLLEAYYAGAFTDEEYQLLAQQGPIGLELQEDNQTQAGLLVGK